MSTLLMRGVILVGIGWVGALGLVGGACAQTAPEVFVERADSLREAHRVEAATAAYERALAGYRRTGDRAGQAHVHKELGILHAIRNQYDAAFAHTDTSIQLYRALGDRENVAKGLNNRAIMQRRSGQYDAALDSYQEALAASRAAGTREDRAVMLNNMGIVHENLGNYRRALDNYRQALAEHRAQHNEVGIANSLDNIGDIFYVQGRYDSARRHFRDALDVYRQRGDSAQAANSLNGMGRVYLAEGALDQALVQFREALSIYWSLNDQSSVAANLNNVGVVYSRQGRYEDALSTLEKALQINREIGREVGVAKNLDEIATIHRKRGEHAAALARYEEALRISREGGRPAEIAIRQQGIGITHLKRGDFAAADSVLRASVRITERLVREAEGTHRRDFLAKEMKRFQALVTTRVRAGRPEAALRAYERSRARLLSERLLRREEASALTVPPVDSLQRAIGEERAAVLYANTDTERPIVAFIVTTDSVRTREISGRGLLGTAAQRYAEALDRLEARGRAPFMAKRASLLQEAKGLRVGGQSKGGLANLVRLYRHELSVPREQRLLSVERRETLGQFLYTLLVRPIETDVETVDELVVVPDGALSYLPFEPLQDWDGTRVVDRWPVRYVQSLRVQYLLRRRSRVDGVGRSRSLLALGGVVYDPATYDADTSGMGRQRGGWGVFETRPADEGRRPDTTLQQRIARSISTYRKHGYGPERWRNLSGTLQEARTVSRIAGRSTLLVGREASERAIHELSRAGQLKEYRALHFATHGFVVPKASHLSALVLSEVGEAREGTVPTATPASDEELLADGYLRMEEIPKLDLRAEFVGLSACQTGLGRIYRGSGAVSLTQAFLRAGAGSVAVSLWSVNDASTSRFMEQVYRRAWQRDVSWAEAIARTKRAFARGTYGRRLQAPRFWAPFVYYGWEDEPTAAN